MSTTKTTDKSTKAKTPAKANGKDPAKPTDAIKLLKSDHKEVEAMFKKYAKLKDDADKQSLADEICLALTVHAQIEEEIYYPAARAVLEDEDLLDEAEVEHASAKQLIAEIKAMKAGDRLFDAKVTVLGEYINHHVEEEEEEMFPETEDTELDLKAIGAQLAERKAELMAKAQK